jgi:hypothetical protein
LASYPFLKQFLEAVVESEFDACHNKEHLAGWTGYVDPLVLKNHHLAHVHLLHGLEEGDGV